MMPLKDIFKAWGHPNIKPSHKTTLMITRDTEVSHRGDCIVSVMAEKGLRDLDPSLKEAMRSCNARIRITIEAGGSTFEVLGRGDPRLVLSHPKDMVARKSSYICDRTLMICADKAACDLDDVIATLLQNSEQVVNIEISVISVTQSRDKNKDC